MRGRGTNMRGQGHMYGQVCTGGEAPDPLITNCRGHPVQDGPNQKLATVMMDR